MQDPKAKAVTYIPATGKFYHGIFHKNYYLNNYRPTHEIARFDNRAIKLGNIDDLAKLDHENYEILKNTPMFDNLPPDKNEKIKNLIRVDIAAKILINLYKHTYLAHGSTFVKLPEATFSHVFHIRNKQMSTAKKQNGIIEINGYEDIRTELNLTKYGALTKIIDVTLDDKHFVPSFIPEHIIDDFAENLACDINQLIIESALTFTKIKKGPWSSQSENPSEYNPSKDIVDEMTRIRNEGGRADTILMNSNTYDHFTDNSHIKGCNAEFSSYHNNIVYFTRFPGIAFIIDNDNIVPDGAAIIYDKRALVVGDGPMTMKASDPQITFDHVITKQIQPIVSEKARNRFGTYMTDLC